MLSTLFLSCTRLPRRGRLPLTTSRALPSCFLWAARLSRRTPRSSRSFSQAVTFEFILPRASLTFCQQALLLRFHPSISSAVLTRSASTSAPTLASTCLQSCLCCSWLAICCSWRPTASLSCLVFSPTTWATMAGSWCECWESLARRAQASMTWACWRSFWSLAWSWLLRRPMACWRASSSSTRCWILGSKDARTMRLTSSAEQQRCLVALRRGERLRVAPPAYLGVLFIDNTVVSAAHNQAMSTGQLSHTINWFPGHMRRALRLIQDNVRRVDLFLEVRDARLPYSSRNPEFDEIVSRNQKQRVIVFNKYDLCDPARTDQVIRSYRELGVACLGVSAREHQDMRRLIGYLAEHYRHKYSRVGLWLMACGMPNVGKSSLINQLRAVSDLPNKRAAAKATPAVATTKGFHGFPILEQPPMHLLDSPGVMVPSAIPPEAGMKMAALGLVKDGVVSKQAVLDFIVEESRHRDYSLLWRSLRVADPLSSRELVESVRNRHKLFDYDAAVDRVLSRFREGQLGRLTLDLPL